MAYWNSVISKLSKIRQLSSAERSLLVQASLLLPLVFLSLHLLSLRRCQAIFARLVPRRNSTNAGHASKCLEQAYAAARLVNVAADHIPFRVTCLQRSLALWWLLRRHGIEPDLHIGVRMTSGPLAA